MRIKRQSPLLRESRSQWRRGRKISCSCAVIAEPADFEPKVAFMRDCNLYAHRRLGPRMKFLVHFTQPFARNIGVHFRGAYAGMAEEFLDHPQVGSVFQQMR